eukprot:318961-Chlamydomonas_euryale.AAC.2
MVNPMRLFGLASDADARSGADAGARGIGVGGASAAGAWLGGDGATAAVASISGAEQIALWCDPWRSFRALALGLYVAVCWTQASRGSALPLLPSTVAAGAALAYLACNSVRGRAGGRAAARLEKEGM